jgi:hypothetical protein
MSYDYRPQLVSDRPTSSKKSSSNGGRYLTTARRSALYAAGPPTEQLARCLPPASLAGQLRVLELQRDNLNRAIAQLHVQQDPPGF